MRIEVKVLLFVIALIVILVVMFGGSDIEKLDTIVDDGYSGFEIGIGMVCLSSFLWVPLLLMLIAPAYLIK